MTSQPVDQSPENPGVHPTTAPLAPGEPDEEQPYRRPAEDDGSEEEDKK